MIVVVVGIVALALIVAASMRGRDQSRRADRQELSEARERPGQGDAGSAQEPAEQPADPDR